MSSSRDFIQMFHQPVESCYLSMQLFCIRIFFLQQPQHNYSYRVSREITELQLNTCSYFYQIFD